MDLGMEPGVDFRDEITSNLAQVSLQLVVIGPSWLIARNPLGQLRLEQSDDWVRKEIATALSRNVWVIPVLVRGAKMPDMKSLPDDVSSLSSRQAFELRDGGWDSDMKLLIRVVARRLFLAHLSELPRMGLFLLRSGFSFIGRTAASHPLIGIGALIATIAGVVAADWRAPTPGLPPQVRPGQTASFPDRTPLGTILDTLAKRDGSAVSFDDSCTDARKRLFAGGVIKGTDATEQMKIAASRLHDGASVRLNISKRGGQYEISCR